MSKKVMKICSILLMAIMIVTSLSQLVFASDINASIFEPTETAAEEPVKKAIGAAIRIVQIVGVGVAIIMLVVLGIKYITSAPNEKADIKKSLMYYVVGALLVFAASGVLEIVRKFVTDVVK